MHMFVDHMISHDTCSLQVIQTLLTSGEAMEVSYNYIHGMKYTVSAVYNTRRGQRLFKHLELFIIHIL